MDPSEFADAFGPQAEHEKLDSFEESSIKLILRQLGKSTREAAEIANLGVDALNATQYLPFWVGTDRCFNYSFLELFTKCSTNHPVTKMWNRWVSDMRDEGDAGCVVFKCSGLGRLVATNIADLPVTHLRVSSRGGRYAIAPFSQFFTPYNNEGDSSG